MERGLRVTILGLCITTAIMLRADAQQDPPTNSNSNRAQFQQLREDIQALRQQCEPIRSQIKELTAQIRALREQLHPIDEQLKADYQKMRALRGEHVHHHPQGVAGQQGQGQHPSGPSTNSETN